MTDRFANLTKCCGGHLSPETLKQFQRAMREYEEFMRDLGALLAPRDEDAENLAVEMLDKKQRRKAAKTIEQHAEEMERAEAAEEPHDAHVKDRDRHLDWCHEQWCLSNGISFVTECGTLIDPDRDL